jgi:hypothetical protein
MWEYVIRYLHMSLWWHTKFAKQKSALSILVYKKNNICHFIHKCWEESYVFSQAASHKSDVSQQISASFSDYCFWNVMPCIHFQVFMASVTQMTVSWIFTPCSMMCSLHSFRRTCCLGDWIWAQSPSLPIPHIQLAKTLASVLHNNFNDTIPLSQHCSIILNRIQVILNMKAEHVPLRHQKTLYYTAQTHRGPLFNAM